MARYLAWFAGNPQPPLMQLLPPRKPPDFQLPQRREGQGGGQSQGGQGGGQDQGGSARGGAAAAPNQAQQFLINWFQNFQNKGGGQTASPLAAAPAAQPPAAPAATPTAAVPATASAPLAGGLLQMFGGF